MSYIMVVWFIMSTGNIVEYHRFQDRETCEQRAAELGRDLRKVFDREAVVFCSAEQFEGPVAEKKTWGIS